VDDIVHGQFAKLDDFHLSLFRACNYLKVSICVVAII